jgi:hypothetical protein
MAGFGERVIRYIVTEEMKLVGCIILDNISARLAAYLDEPERTRLLAEASAASGQEVIDLFDAFVELLPMDYHIEAVLRGIKLKPFPPRRALPS